MGKARKVIDRMALPVKPPFLLTAVAIVVMDFYNAPGWVIGAVGVFLAILWIGFFVSFDNEERIDPFADPEPGKEKNIFQKKIDELKNHE